MTLKFQMRREDVLAFSREFNAASPAFQRAKARARSTVPLITVILWVYFTLRYGFGWGTTLNFLGIGLLWFFYYPEWFARNVGKYCEKEIDEGSSSKSFGPCELTLNDSGLHSISPSGESKFHWSSVDRCLLTDTYLFIFLNGPIGYPIPIGDIGGEAAQAAHDYVVEKIAASCDGDNHRKHY